jgi:DegV family protein with EDD domain
MTNIALVTDSTADIPEDLVNAYHISVIPNLVIINEKSLRDGIDITRQEFYERLPTLNPYPTTATASPGAYERIYASRFEEGATSIVSIHAPENLSGIFNAASTAAQNFDDQVTVVDSGQLSLGLGFQVLAAAEAITSGASLKEVLEIIQDASRRARVFAMFDTLDYVRRSGRVSWARAHLGNLFQIKPFIELRNGQVLNRGEARTRRRGIARLMQFLWDLGKIERLAILHTNAEAEARQILADLDLNLVDSPRVVFVTTVIGVHVGPNALGFAALVK